tara:strand:- start:14 stop:229 length:216 start_codon:yes stop_codon:yes gene_type:complete
MAKVKQPSPIDGWKEYQEQVNTHIMNTYGCITHEDCHLDSFYPGKIYRQMPMTRNENGLLIMDKGMDGRGT